MNKLVCFCKGIVRIIVSGYSPERFLNLCKMNEIPLFNVTNSKYGYEMDVYAKDIFALKKLLKKTGTKLKIRKKSGLPFILFRYRRHKFFVVGIALAFICMVIMSQLIWEIEIKGNYTITDETFLKYLESQNIHYGSWISKIDCEAIEEQIRNDYPEIIWVSAYIDGTRLILDVQEIKQESGEGKRNLQNGTDLVASCDGVVRSIVTREGTPLVVEGTEVKKGDILISGCNELYDDYGTIIGYEYCESNADVLIEYETTYKDTITRMYPKPIETGKNHQVITIQFPKESVTLGFAKKTYENQRCYMHQYQLQLGKRMRFPVWIQHNVIQEVEIENVPYTEEEIEEVAKRNFSLYTKKMEKKGFQIIDKNGKIKVNDKMVYITGTVVFQYYETNRVSTPKKSLELEEGT